jgi:hypothetical protein
VREPGLRHLQVDRLGWRHLAALPAAAGGNGLPTGSLIAPAITIVFPPPFALTLSGQISLQANSTIFTGLPDIPLTDLNVTLSGGANAVFVSSCTHPQAPPRPRWSPRTGTRPRQRLMAFAVSNCTATLPSTATHPITPTTSGPTKSGPPKLTSASFSGLRPGKSMLSFKLTAGKSAPKLSSFTIKLPSGLSFSGHRPGTRTRR